MAKKKLSKVPELDTISMPAGNAFTLSAKALERFKVAARITDSCIIKRNFLYTDAATISSKMMISDLPDGFRFPTSFLNNFLGMVTAFKRAVIDYSNQDMLTISNSDNPNESFTIVKSDEKYINTIPDDAKMNASEKFFTFHLTSDVLTSILDKSKIISAAKIVITNRTNKVSIKSKMNLPNAPEYEQLVEMGVNKGLSVFLVEYSTLRLLDSKLDYDVEVYEDGMHFNCPEEQVEFFVGARKV